MSTATHEAETAIGLAGRYVYAIIDQYDPQRPLDLRGLDGAEVYALGAGDVAAVVSHVAPQKVRPERRKLAAHHDVLKRLMDDYTVLPMAFGLIADSTEAVARILQINHSAFASQFRRVRGRVEMGLRVKWDVPNIFEYAVGIHAELAELRDRIFRGGREPSQDEKIELGRTFDRLLSADREAHVERVEHVLGSRVIEIVSNKARDDREVMNLACLIDRNHRQAFEQAVVEAAGAFDSNYAFDFNGPWPPHNFVEIELRVS
jgi:hypothetical protein